MRISQPFPLFLFISFMMFLSACGTQRDLADTVEVRDIQAYELFSAEGKQISYSDVVRMAVESDIILFGELHNSAIAHWLQHELTRDLATSRRSLVLGMEMFEQDQQQLLDSYLSGEIDTDQFEEDARLWNNYATDYKPIIEFAKNEGIPVVASNIPRRFASMVYHEGIEILDDLSDEAKESIAPLPIEIDLELPGYQNIMEMAHGHGGENLPKSQAVKDATMGYFILQHKEGNSRVLHLNGSYHSDNYEGIYWYLRHYGFEGNIMTITTVERDNPEAFDEELEGTADIILQVNTRMTRTY